MKMVSFLGFLGSKSLCLPLAIFLSCAASAELMLEDVCRTYSRAAVRAGSAAGTSGHVANWIDFGSPRISRQTYSAQWGAIGVRIRALIGCQQN